MAYLWVALYGLMGLRSALTLWPDVQTLLVWGASYRPPTVQEPWRLVSAGFLLPGVMPGLLHILAWMYVARLGEEIMGSFRLLWVWAITGVWGSLASLLLSPDVVSAGPVAGIMGVCGAMGALISLGVFDETPTRMLSLHAGVFLLYNIMLALAGRLDITAQLTGLLAGALLGYLLYPALSREQFGRRSVLTIMLLTLVTAGAASYLLRLAGS